MLLLWDRFAERYQDKGQKLMATYMRMNDPVLNGTVIELELPNESTKEDFLLNKNELLGYLRGKLNNHDISIEIVVNEVKSKKYVFTSEEKFEYLNKLNPSLDVLRKIFDLDF